jgi:anti-sigma-K factor RskA
MNEHFEDVGAYLLGALSEDERISFEAELERNEALRAEVEHLRVAADALPGSPIQMTPPPELKDRIMTVVHAEAQLLNAAQPEPRRRRRTLAVLKPGWWSLRPGLALAMTLLVLVLGAGTALVGERVLGDTEQVTVADLGQAKLIQRESGHSTLTATGLKNPGIDRVYQVWLQSEGEQPRPTNALFSARSDGTASVDVPGSLKNVDAVLVTSEPEGGSEQPTTKPVIIAHPA